MVQVAPEKWQASSARVPSLPTNNQSVVHLEVQTCPLPSIAAFANGLSARAMPGSRRLGKQFQWRRYNIVTDSNVLCKETFIWNNVPCDKRGKLLPIGGAAYTCNYTTSP